MTAGQQQLLPFELPSSSSTSCVPISPSPSGSSTPSRGFETSTTTDAARTDPTARATVRSLLDSVGPAATPKRDASSTATLELPLTRSRSTERDMEARMLAVPRPTTRAQCREEARPCPWVGCRHHLLLEVGQPKDSDKPRATSIRLNLASATVTRKGRRAGLRSSAAEGLVRMWIDQAAESLGRMRSSCTLDVVDANPDGISIRGIALRLGTTRQAAEAELGRVLAYPQVRALLRAIAESNGYV